METTPLRRQNGRPQACDPCRNRKVACDHTRPICQRCRKRKQDDECVYTGATLPPNRRSTSRRSTPQPQTISAPIGSGYFGLTSHSTVFEETRNSLLLHGSEVRHPANARRGVIISLRDSSPIREMCLHVLRVVAQVIDNYVPFPKSTCHPDELMRMTINCVVQTLRDTFRAHLANGDRLEELAQILCENTTRPIRDIAGSHEEWIDQLTGLNVRWESIGLLWVFWKFEPNPDTPQIPPREVIASCLGYCIMLARDFSPGNELLLHLCLRQGRLLSMIEGDASKLNSIQYKDVTDRQALDAGTTTHNQSHS